MISSPPKRNIRKKQTSTQSGGGCFSVPSFPIIFLLVLSAIFLMATGETTKPWDLEQAEPATSLPTTISITRTEGNGQITPLFTPEVLYWEDDIVRWANEWGLDPNLAATVMQIESCGDPKALSPAGAMGLFQVMPYHFNTSEAPYHPNTNAKSGLAYLREALDIYNSVRLAFAGYNGGISTAGKAENLWKAETQRYVYWGTNIYRDARKGMSHSPTLDEWLSHGGASLCAQARQRLGFSP